MNQTFTLPNIHPPLAQTLRLAYNIFILMRGKYGHLTSIVFISSFRKPAHFSTSWVKTIPANQLK